MAISQAHYVCLLDNLSGRPFLLPSSFIFVLSGPAFLTSFHPATTPIFSSWIRLYIVTIFEQFIQFFIFGLDVQFEPPPI